MPTVIRLEQQRLRREHGISGALDPMRMAYAAGVVLRSEAIGSAPAHEAAAREAGVMALLDTVKKPKTNEQKPENTLTDDQLRDLADSALLETVDLVDADAELVDA